MTTTDKKPFTRGHYAGSMPDGLWPVINIETTEDFAKQYPPKPPEPKRAAPGAESAVTRYLSIHMDVPLKSKEIFEAVRDALDRGEREEAHRILMGDKILPPGTPRAHAFLKMALRND